MSTTIDQRVVEMRFDNKQFEENVKTSMSTLDKLKQSLNFTGASKGLENISDAVKNFDMSGLSNAIQTVRVKFSSLEVMAITALANITNSAINAGKQLISSFKIEPIKLGFQEYETQINAIQTILANTSSKGTTLEQVNAALDELNKYADKTIYNFTEMTRNIGTFTAAGVDLDTSVKAIKGIANLAAVSGSTSQQASTAMYQLSQALAAGTVKLQDWNSVVNAGMGGQVFQDALKETARVHGIAIDRMIKAEGSFRETLKKGWLTSEILTETLAKFTGDLNEDQLRTMGYTDEQIKSIIKMGQTANDAATKVKTFTQLFDTLKEAAQSGWTQSWEIIVGDFEEAKELLTEISDIFGGLINESADARNAVLQGWKDLGGRTQVIKALKNTFEGLMSIITPVKEAFREIFPPITAERLYAFSEGLRKLTEHLKLSETTSANLKSTFKGLFAILDIIQQAFWAVINGMLSLFGETEGLRNGILGITADFGDWLVKLDETIKTTDIFNKAVQRVVDFIKMAVTAVKDFVKSIAEKFDFPGFELFHSLLERVHERMAQVGEAAGKMKFGVLVAIELMGEALANSKFLQVFEALWKGVKTIAGGIASALGSLISDLVEKIGNADFKGILDIVNSLIAGGIGIGLKNFLKSATDTFKGFQDITDGIVDIFDGVRGALEAYQTQLKAGTLLKIASAIGILAASILVISLIDSEKLTASLGAITVLFADLMGSMALFGKTSGNLTGVFKTTTAMIGLSFAVLILASALKKISELDFNEMTTGLIGVLGLTATMVAAVKNMGSDSSIIKGATQMVMFAAAIKILASVCEDLSQLSLGELAKGLTGLTIILAEVVAATRFMGDPKHMMSTGIGMIALGASMLIFAEAVEHMGQLSWEEIGKGLITMAGALTAITIATKFLPEGMINKATGMVVMGAALLIIGEAVEKMGSLSWDEIARGFTTLAGALAAITLALNFMPKDMVGIGVGLVAVGAALLIVSEALENMGSMSWDEIAKGLAALGGSLLIITFAMNAMTSGLPGAAAMLVMAGAIGVLTPALVILGQMNLAEIGKALLTLAGVFGVVGVAGLLLAPLTPVILGLAAALALIGVGVLGIGAGLLAAGAGLSALAVGFTALAAAGASGATAIVAALTVIITGVASLIPVVIEKIGEGVIAFAKVISNGIPAIMEAVKQISLALIQVLVEITPPVVEALLLFLTTLLEQLANSVPQMVDAGMRLIIGILDGVASHIMDVVAIALEIIAEFLKGIAEGIPDIVSAGVDIVVAFLTAIGEEKPRIIDAGFKMVIDFINGLADAIRTNTPLICEAMGNLADAMIEGLKSFLGIHSPSKVFADIGMNVIQGFINGIDNMNSDAVQAIIKVVTGMISAITNNKMGEFLSKGKESMTNFKNGVSNKLSDVKNAATDVISNVLSGIGDKLSEFTSMGSNLINGLKIGIQNAADDVVSAVKGVVSDTISAAKNLLGIHSPSKVFKEIGDNVATGLAIGIDKGTPKVEASSEKMTNKAVTASKKAAAKTAKEAEKAAKDAFKASVDWIDERKYYNELSLYEELDAWERVQSRYLKGTEERKKADREVYRVKKEIAQADIDFAQKVIDVSRDAMNKRIQYEKEYLDECRRINDQLERDIRDLNEQYEQALESRTKALYDAYGLFDKVEPKDEVLGSDLIKNLRDQVNEFDEWTRQMDELSGKGVDSALIDELQKMGPKSLSEIKALNKLSEPELKEYVSLWREKSNQARTVATKELEWLRIETSNKIKMLKEQAEIDLEEQRVIFEEKTKQLAEETAKTIENMKNDWLKKIGELRAKGEKDFKMFADNIVSIMCTPDWMGLGQDIVDGMRYGVLSKASELAQAAAETAISALEAARDALGIESPSKEFAELGKWSMVGFAEGLKEYSHLGMSSAADMGMSAISTLKNIISAISDVINDNADIEPVIRPVLDLSDVEAGSLLINDLLSKNKGINVTSAIRNLPTFATSSESYGTNRSETPQEIKVSFVQNNYSPKALSRIEIYRQTKNQISTLRGLRGVIGTI